MRECFGNLFDLDKFDAICVATNGIVKSSGLAVMGAGVAKICAQTWPQTQVALGECLSLSNQNIPFQIGIIDKKTNEYIKNIIEETDTNVCRVFSFPTKNHYSDQSDINLIKSSCKFIIDFANLLNLNNIGIHKVGCGLGGLDFNLVKPILSDYLDDRFILIMDK